MRAVGKALVILLVVTISLAISINIVLYNKGRWTVIVNEVSPVLRRPINFNGNDKDYIKEYLTPNVLVTKREYTPLYYDIDCLNNDTESVRLYYLYARIKPDYENRAALSCFDTIRNNICPGQTYLEDPRLFNILSNVSSYLTKNLLTENDLIMASQVLEFQTDRANNAMPAYEPNYSAPKIVYLITSFTRPSNLPLIFNHIRENADNSTVIYTTFDYNSQHLDDYKEIIASTPDIKSSQIKWLANWGGISLVYLEISAWLDLLRSDDWDYIINISDMDGFVVPADVIHERVTELNGISILGCPLSVPYPDDQNETCIHVDTNYRYSSVWVDCGSSIRAAYHPKFSPNYPPYANFTIKSSQWRILSRSVIEDLVASQEFWDIVFSYRNSFVPDEHVLINAMRRIISPDRFTFRSVHKKFDFWNTSDIDDAEVAKTIEQGYWFLRRVRYDFEREAIERVREKYFGQRKIQSNSLEDSPDDSKL